MEQNLPTQNCHRCCTFWSPLREENVPTHIPTLQREDYAQQARFFLSNPLSLSALFHRSYNSLWLSLDVWIGAWNTFSSNVDHLGNWAGFYQSRPCDLKMKWKHVQINLMLKKFLADWNVLDGYQHSDACVCVWECVTFLTMWLLSREKHARDIIKKTWKVKKYGS